VYSADQLDTTEVEDIWAAFPGVSASKVGTANDDSC
jgi:hypothetical protein